MWGAPSKHSRSPYPTMRSTSERSSNCPAAPITCQPSPPKPANDHAKLARNAQYQHRPGAVDRRAGRWNRAAPPQCHCEKAATRAPPHDTRRASYSRCNFHKGIPHPPLSFNAGRNVRRQPFNVEVDEDPGRCPRIIAPALSLILLGTVIGTEFGSLSLKRTEGNGLIRRTI